MSEIDSASNMKKSAFEEMREHYQHPYSAAMEWKKKGGKVVGYFCDSVPEEMISAAGFFPLRINGDPKGRTDLAETHLIPRFTSRETFVDSMLNKILSGEYDFLDFLVIPHSRDSIHRLYQLLAMLKRTTDIFDLPELHFIDTLHTPFYSSGNYVRAQLMDFKRKLEDWSGKHMTDAALSQALEVTGESKRLHRKVVELRSADPSRISGVQALQIIGSSMFMLKEDHNRLLKKYLEKAAELPSQNTTRLFVSGSPLDNLQLYEIIESCGATVIAEDHCWGNRHVDLLPDCFFNPLDAVIERYLFKPPCAWMFPTKRRIEYCRRKIEASNVQGVIFNLFEHDEAEAWEVPQKINLLKNMGIESLYLRNQPYLIPEPNLKKMRIEVFLTSLNPVALSK